MIRNNPRQIVNGFNNHSMRIGAKQIAKRPDTNTH